MTAPDSTAMAPDATPDAGPDLAAEVEKWKKLSRENETRAKANAEAAKRLEAIEQSQQTEAERAAKAQQEAAARAEQAEARALRLEVAFDMGLTPAQAKRLVGSTKEELQADAEEIKRDFPVNHVPAAPRPDPSQGPRGGKPSARDEGKAEAARRFGTTQH